MDTSADSGTYISRSGGGNTSSDNKATIIFYLNSLGRDSASLLSDHLENPKHHIMGCDTLTPKDIRLNNIQPTL